MPDTVALVRRRVRLLTDDLDPNNYAIDSERLTTLLENRMQMMASEVGLGPSWSLNAVTLVAGTYIYSLSASVQYNNVIAVQSANQNWLLTRITPSELQALRDGPTQTQGWPSHYALYEDTSQVVNLWLHPAPSAADYLNVLSARVPASLSTDAINIPFSDPLLRALEKWTALDAILLMDPEERAARKAVLDVAEKWEQEAKRAIRLERVRRGNLKRSDQVPQRWV